MAKRILKIGGIVLLSAVLLVGGFIAVTLITGQGHLSLSVNRTEQFSSDKLAQFPSRLRAEGNRLVNADGDTVRLRGVMPVDPHVLRDQGQFNRRFFEEIRDAGANVVRIPVHPEYWRDDPDYLWRYLDPAVEWAGELGMYAIIDFHSIGNVQTGSAPLMPELYSHTYEMAQSFWQQVAAHFRTAPNVLFEVFNEPQGIQMQAWHDSATELIGIIRQQRADQVVIVGGLNYAKDLSWVADNPITDGNAAYAAHIYPGDHPVLWNAYFGNVAEQYPVLVTEWGFMDENRTPGEDYLAGSAEDYGQPLMQYLGQRGIGWAAAWWDNAWSPPMFGPDGATPTHYGTFVLARLASK